MNSDKFQTILIFFMWFFIIVADFFTDDLPFLRLCATTGVTLLSIIALEVLRRRKK